MFNIWKTYRAHLTQGLLLLFLLAMPLCYFIQKSHYIHSDFYTERMDAISEQIGTSLEREVIWEDSKDEAQSSIMYTAYYYPQALSVVCQTTPVTYLQDQDGLGAAYLISDSGTLYPATLLQDTEYNSTLLIFEEVPSEFVRHLQYLDIVPASAVPENGSYEPDSPLAERIRYTLQGDAG